MTANRETLSRFAAGDPDAEREALPLLRKGLQAWFRAGFETPLERCLGVDPVASRSQALARRDYWLTEAHGLCDGVSPWAKSCKLAEELARFEGGTIWRAWRDDADPPAGASALNTAMFYAMKAAQDMPRARWNAMPSTARQLHEIVKSKPDATSQTHREDDVMGSPDGVSRSGKRED